MELDKTIENGFSNLFLQYFLTMEDFQFFQCKVCVRQPLNTYFFFVDCRYQEAINKLKQALKTESKLAPLVIKARRQLCHCHVKVGQLFCFLVSKYFGMHADTSVESEHCMVVKQY